MQACLEGLPSYCRGFGLGLPAFNRRSAAGRASRGWPTADHRHIRLIPELVETGTELRQYRAEDEHVEIAVLEAVPVGESSGTLDNVLDEVARFHEAQLERMIRRLTALIEPAVIIIVGSVVGYVYLSFFMALFAATGPGNNLR